VTIFTSDITRLLNQIEGWFRRRQDITLVAQETSRKLGLGVLVLEWESGPPDRLFLDILADDPAVEDVGVYLRSVDACDPMVEQEDLSTDPFSDEMDDFDTLGDVEGLTDDDMVEAML
jgi:hypothetical protein